MFGRNLSVLLVCLAAGVVSHAFADNPYSAILSRNVFGLRSAPATKKDPERGPLPNVHLTGITTILQGKRALLKVEFPAKPPARPKEESYILKEGQRAGPIEVLEIDEKSAHVRVNNSGTITNLTFEKIGPAPAPALPITPASHWNRLPYRSGYR